LYKIGLNTKLTYYGSISKASGGGCRAAAPPEITDFVDTMVKFYVIYSSATKIS